MRLIGHSVPFTGLYSSCRRGLSSGNRYDTHRLSKYLPLKGGERGVSKPPEPGALPAGQPWPPLAVLSLSLANVRFLLQAALPQPTLDVSVALATLAYWQQRNVAAYRSHRKRLLARLARPG